MLGHLGSGQRYSRHFLCSANLDKTLNKIHYLTSFYLISPLWDYSPYIRACAKFMFVQRLHLLMGVFLELLNTVTIIE